MKIQKILSIAISFVVLLAVTVSAVTAQQGSPTLPQAPVTVDAAVNSRIGYQGVLKESGAPVTGTRNMTFRLYDDSACTSQVGSDIVKNGVQVTNGLFNVALDVTQSNFNGQGLWVRLVIGATSIGCQEILPAPYALSLRPGASIQGHNTNALAPTLYVESSGSEFDTALTAMVNASNGFAGYFWNLDASGAAIFANGKISSSEKSYLWMSGNGLRKYNSSDTTIIDANGLGGATIYSGAAAGGMKYVTLPISIVAPLYGQDVTLTDLDIYWIGEIDLSGIGNIRLRRQSGPNSYVDIIFDQGPGNAGYNCQDDVFPNGCTLHLDLTTNNVLTADSGVLYLVIGINFSSDAEWNRLNGFRLTMEHD
jgi:hypothetical protein